MVTRWWIVFCVSVLWDTVSLNNVKTQPECCPCPKDGSVLPPGTDGFPDLAAAGSGGEGLRAAAWPLDDCPCRLRAADSEGAPSVFFPTAVRAMRPFVNLEDSKENPDPLLHPEVNLASSVLETLRQATDEEYVEALARDVARSAADGEAAESARNLVTVIINPKDAMTDDDAMSEASHVHEARCINPSLGRSRTSVYKPILLTDILNLPRTSPTYRTWNLFDTIDNGVGASDVNEHILEPDFPMDGESSRNALYDTKPLSPLEKLNLKLPKLNLNNQPSSLSAQSKLRTPDKIELPRLSSLIPKLNTQNLLRRSENDAKIIASDTETAPSIFKERYKGFARDSNDDFRARPIPNIASNIEDSSISKIIAKPKIPNLLRNDGDERNVCTDSENAASFIKEQRTSITDEGNEDIINTRPKQTYERPSIASKIETPDMSNLKSKLKIPSPLGVSTASKNTATFLKEQEKKAKNDGSYNDITLTRSNNIPAKPRIATKVGIPDKTNLVLKSATPNLLRPKQATRPIKEQQTSFAKEKFKVDDIMKTKPILSIPRAKPVPKLELPRLSNVIANLKTPNLLRRNDNEDTLDSQNAASDLKERYTSFARDDSKNDDTMILRPVQASRDATTDLLSNLLKGLEVPNLANLFSSDIFNLQNNDQDTKFIEEKTVKGTSETKPFATEILDTVPSPSDIKSDQISFAEVDQKGGLNEIDMEGEEIQKIIENNPMKTEIIDHIPTSSDIRKIGNEHINVLSDTCEKANVNADTNDVNTALNNEMEENNEDIIDDSIISESEKESNLEPVSPEELEVTGNNNLITIDGSQIINSDIIKMNDDQLNEVQVKNCMDENKSISLEDRIKNRFNNLKDRSKLNKDMKKFEKFEPTDFIAGNADQQLKEESAQIVDNVPFTKIIDQAPEESQVDIEDLQQMSDSLLSEERERGQSQSEDNEDESNMKIETEEEFVSDEILENGTNDLSSKDNSNSLTLETNNLNSVNVPSTNGVECIQKDAFSTPDGLLPESNLKSINNNMEMESEASEKVIDAVNFNDRLRSPLGQAILQPPSLSDLNLFNLPTLNINDVLNINRPLPALKFTDIFNARDSTDVMSSTHDDDIDDLDTKQTMSPSTTSFKSALPTLPRLEDINLDILQLKPLGSEAPTIPRLNLNSFKTKLAIPESLQLKPLLLESSVGNKKGVIGASFTFGNDEWKGTGRSNMLEQASLKQPNILRRPLGTWPSLDDLRSTVLENAHNLLNTPLETTSKNAFEDTLRSGHVLTENLRVGAENTVKDIQRNLASTFKGVGLNNNGLWSSTSFRGPNDFFEEISRKHEDVNDKLRGISYDLSDRLETLRNNIFDDYRTPSFTSNILDRMSALGSSMPKQGTLVKPKQKSAKMASKGKKTSLGSDTGTKGRFITRSSTNNNKLKMPAAATIVSPKTVSSPNLRTAQSSIFKGIGKEPTGIHLTREKPSLFQKMEKNTIDTSRPLLKKPSLPKLGKSNIKITFSTTPAPPILKSKGRFKDINKQKSVLKEPFTLPTLSKSASKEKPGLLSSLRDSNGYASEPVSSRIRAPIEGRQRIKDLQLSIRPKAATLDDEVEDKGTVQNKTPRPDVPGPKPPVLEKVYTGNLGHSEVRKPILKPKSPMVLPHSNGAVDKINTVPSRTQQRTPPLWPKAIDDKFLVKVRDALRARLAGLGQGLNANTNARSSVNGLSEQLDTPRVGDMERSASNNIDMTGVGPAMMKENTSYTCKMMCTKNS